ncbi:hypothetical protein K420107F6_10830 [Lactonifactor longoviformis]|nr:hypothetical protein [Lactonifactor longoviformis]
MNRRAEDFASGFVEGFIVELVSHHAWSALKDLRDIGENAVPSYNKGGTAHLRKV